MTLAPEQPPPPTASQLLSRVNSQFLEDSLACHAPREQKALRKWLGITLLQIAQDAQAGNAHQLHEDFVASFYFSRLQHWEAKPDKHLVADVVTRLEQNKAWQPKDIPHAVWAINKYGCLRRTKASNAEYGRAPEQVYADLLTAFQQPKKGRPVCYSTDGEQLAGHILHWQQGADMQAEQSATFRSVRTLPYNIGPHRCACAHVLPTCTGRAARLHSL